MSMTVSVKNENITFEISMSREEFGKFSNAVDAICMSPMLMKEGDEKVHGYMANISELKNNMVMALNQ